MAGQKRLFSIAELLRERNAVSLHQELMGLLMGLKRADAEGWSGFERRQARRLIGQLKRELKRREAKRTAEPGS